MKKVKIFLFQERLCKGFLLLLSFHTLFNHLIYINSCYQTTRNYQFMSFVLQPEQSHNEKIDLERNKLLFPSSTKNNIQIQIYAILPDCKKKL